MVSSVMPKQVMFVMLITGSSLSLPLLLDRWIENRFGNQGCTFIGEAVHSYHEHVYFRIWKVLEQDLAAQKLFSRHREISLQSLTL
jgi:hypothetical protein